MLGMRVKKETVRLGLHRDLELDSVPDKPYTAEELERLDAFTEEIANEKMLGAYYTMGEPYSERDLLQTTLAVSADALAYKTAKTDPGQRQDYYGTISRLYIYSHHYLPTAKRQLTLCYRIRLVRYGPLPRTFAPHCAIANN